MPDAYLEWGEDFRLTPAGDLALADGDDFARQRIERRLFTSVQGYLWHLEYGAGLPQKVGSTYQPYQIEAIVRAQMLLEESVVANPPPKVKVTTDTNNPGLYVIRIDYTNAPTNRQVALTFSV